MVELTGDNQIECYICGTLLEPQAETCPSCGAYFPGGAGKTNIEQEVITQFTTIPGIGKKKARALYEAGFRNVEDLKSAAQEKVITNVKGISEGISLKIVEHFNPAELFGEEKKEAGLFLCPNCGAFLGEESKTCSVCGVTVEEGEGESEGDLGDLQEFEADLEALSEEAEAPAPEEATTSEGGGLFLCPVCGAFMSADATKCAKCGTELGVEEEEETFEEAEELTSELEEIAEIDTGEGTDGSTFQSVINKAFGFQGEPRKAAEGAETAPEAEGTRIEPEETAPAPEPAGVPPPEPLGVDMLELTLEGGDAEEKRVTSAVRTRAGLSMCGVCGAFLKTGSTSCEICGAELEEEVGIDEVAPKGEAKPTEPLELDKAAFMRALRIRGDVPEASIEEEPGGAFFMCSSCGAFMSDSASACPICGTRVEDMREVEVSDREVGQFRAATEESPEMCSICGAFVKSGADRCEICGADLGSESRIRAASMEQVIEPEPDVPDEHTRHFFGVGDTLPESVAPEAEMGGALFLCEECGAFLSERAVRCPICGEPTGVEGPEEPEPVPSPAARPVAEQVVEGTEEAVPSLEAEAPQEAEPVEGGGALVGIGGEAPHAMDEAKETAFMTALMEAAGIGGQGEDNEAEAVAEQLRALGLEGERVEVFDVEGITDQSQLESILAEAGALEAPFGGIGEERVAADSVVQAATAPPHQTPPLEEPGLAIGGYASPEKSHFICPICKTLVDEDATYCPACHVQFKEESVEEPVAEVSVEEMLEQVVEEAAPEVSVVDEAYAGAMGAPSSETAYKLLPETTPPPSAPSIRRRRSRRSPLFSVQLDRNRDIALYTSLVMAIVVGVSALLPLPGREREVIFGLTVFLSSSFLLVVAFGLVYMYKARMSWDVLKRSTLFVFGLAVLSIVPLYWYIDAFVGGEGIGGPHTPTLDASIAIIGVVMASFGALRLKENMDYLVTWIGGLLFLFLYGLQVLEGFAAFPSDIAYSYPVYYLAALGSMFILAAVVFRLYGRMEYLVGQADVLKGNQLFVAERYDGALSAYDQAIRSTHGAVYDDVPWYSKGAVLVKLGRYEDAIRCLNRALMINPSNEITWNSKGNALVRLGRYYEAMRCFNEAISINPRYEIAWNNKGNLYARMKRYEEAIQCYNRAIEMEPAYKDAWINKGYVLVRIGKFDEAVSCADMAARYSIA